MNNLTDADIVAGVLAASLGAQTAPARPQPRQGEERRAGARRVGRRLELGAGHSAAFRPRASTSPPYRIR